MSTGRKKAANGSDKATAEVVANGPRGLEMGICVVLGPIAMKYNDTLRQQRPKGTKHTLRTVVMLCGAVRCDAMTEEVGGWEEPGGSGSFKAV